MPSFNELTSLMATHVSYVRRGANKRKFFLKKSDGQPDAFTLDFDVFINREEEEKKLVYGIVYEPDTPDTEGDFASAETIEKAAHDFLADYRNIDLKHNFIPGSGVVVESYIAPTTFFVGEQEVKKGSWVLVTKASDEIWREIKDGTITGYSLAGRAVRRQVHCGDLYTMKGDKKLKKSEVLELISQAVAEAVEPIEARLAAVESHEDTKPDDERGAIAKAVNSAVLEAVAPISERMSAVEKARGISRQHTAQAPLIEKSVFSGLNI